jgi:hypothetical protein
MRKPAACGCTTSTCNCRPCNAYEFGMMYMRRRLAEMLMEKTKLSMVEIDQLIGQQYDDEVEKHFKSLRQPAA